MGPTLIDRVIGVAKAYTTRGRGHSQRNYKVALMINSVIGVVNLELLLGEGGDVDGLMGLLVNMLYL